MLVLGGEQLSGVHPCPSSNTEMRENIEKKKRSFKTGDLLKDV
jgi:hypothetical protein